MRDAFETKVDGGIPDELPVGLGTCAVLRGWCLSSGARVRSIRVFLDGREQPHAGLLPRPRKGGMGYRWWAVVFAHPPEGPRRVTVELEARIGWRRRVRRELGTKSLLVGWEPSQLDFEAAALRTDGSITGALSLRPKIAVCAALHPANADELKGFCDALAAQTYENWMCVICDTRSGDQRGRLPLVAEDRSRFAFLQAGDGTVYGGLEQALMYAPADAPYIVLTDPHERLQPGTLQSLVDGLAPESNAVAPLGTPDKKPNAPSIVRRLRGRAEDELPALILGERFAAGPLLFRRELLRYVLPLPPAERAESRPNGWIQIVARALGDVSYRPMPQGGLRDPSGYGDRQATTLPDVKHRPWSRRKVHRRGLNQAIQLKVTSQVLQARCGDFLSRDHRRQVRRMESGGVGGIFRSPRSVT